MPFDIPNNARLFLYWVVTEFSLVRQSPSIELNLFGHVIHVDCSIPEEASGLPVPILRSLDIIIIVPDTHSTFLLHHVPYEARSLISHHNNVGIASNAGETLEMILSNGHVVGAVDRELRFRQLSTKGCVHLGLLHVVLHILDLLSCRVNRRHLCSNA